MKLFKTFSQNPYPALRFFVLSSAWVVASPLAFLLRLGKLTEEEVQIFKIYTFVGVPLKIFLVYAFDLYRQSWRQAGFPDLLQILKAVLVSTWTMLSVSFLLSPSYPVPRSIPFLEGILSLLLLSGGPFLRRALKEGVTSFLKKGKKILIVGAGDTGVTLLKQLSPGTREKYHIVGFVDDDPRKWGSTVAGVPVLGNLNDLPTLIKKYPVEEIAIAIPSLPGHRLREILRITRDYRIRWKRIVPYIDFLSTHSPLKEISLEDLLRRTPRGWEKEDLASYLKNKTVLITGAGGSIGSQIARQVSEFEPKLLLLLGRGENSLFLLEQTLKDRFPTLSYEILIGDIRNLERMEYIFQTYKPEVVFHTAAHKHVPYMERNPEEAITNNVFGTRNLLELSLQTGVERFVNISTDKAVNPRSIMGASKRVGEILVSYAGRRAPPSSHYVSVRFGNVLGSRGSVVPLFVEQIQKGGPVTITHPDAERYFMTVEEAVLLTLKAGKLGGKGVVYVLDMGPPVRIVDLAYDLIHLFGYIPEKDIPILFTGLRPGEKIREELLTAEEGIEPTGHPYIFLAKNPTPNLPELDLLLSELGESIRKKDPEKIQETLRKIVPTYTPYLEEEVTYA